uniref:hypothetical protein n=1 Tax=Herbidospora sakaeratensis TaxID=564415 RepID=UPI0007856780|nr:hypothetical protein [Herbidospora sakaeratensis]
MYWDPLPEALEQIAVRRHLAGHFRGTWERRNPLNVPGPFYGADTDTCGAGPIVAPRHVLCDAEGQEFVYRQARDRDGLGEILDAIEEEPFGDYARDGDDRWTPESVREWWARRGQVRAFAESLAAEYATSDRDWDRDRVPALRDFAASIDNGELEEYLRNYLFWLTERRSPRDGEPLPDLGHL